MSAATLAIPEAPATGVFTKIRWAWRHDRNYELKMTWWALVVFYQLFGIVFAIMTRVMPPPKPWWSDARVVQWFADNRSGLLWGFGIIFLISGLVAAQNALIAYSIRRMSVSRAFAYSYIAIYSLSTIPGLLFCAIMCVVGAMRPDRDPALIHWLYDTAMLTFNGTMGVFLVGTIVWMIAILLDKNRVFPRWFGYMQICNAITELVISPAWIIKCGPFAWNGMVTFWIDTLVFVAYTTAFIILLKRVAEKDDLGNGPFPT
jgi:hypothetical protein